MAWNPDPTVAVARDIAKKHGADQVIVILIHRDTGVYESASYGRTRELCAEAGLVLDDIVPALDRSLQKRLA